MGKLLLLLVLLAVGAYFYYRTPAPAQPEVVAAAPPRQPTARELEIKSLEKEAAKLRYQIEVLSVEAEGYTKKTGATAIRAPVALRNKIAAFGHRLRQIEVDLAGLRNSDIEYPLPKPR